MKAIHSGSQKLLFFPCLVFLLPVFAPLAGAADSVSAASQLQPPVTINTGDNAWMLASSALVLMMTAPGLILFYGGLVRSKNVLSTMMHSLISVSYTHLRAHETGRNLVCRLLLEKKK